MPQNTPMKRQFTTIDGRTVMSNLPQHWGGNNWTITGVDNPLPVGNYVQTESGVWIPQKGSDDGAADVRLTGSKVEYVELHNRSIRTKNTGDRFIRMPKGAKQVLIYLDVHGVTGNVESGGAYLYITPRTDNNLSVGFIASSKVNVSGRGLIMSLGKGTTHLTDVARLPRYEYVDMSLPTLFGIDLRIDGDFSSSEGIDCEAYLEWYF